MITECARCKGLVRLTDVSLVVAENYRQRIRLVKPDDIAGVERTQENVSIKSEGEASVFLTGVYMTDSEFLTVRETYAEIVEMAGRDYIGAYRWRYDSQ